MKAPISLCAWEIVLRVQKCTQAYRMQTMLDTNKCIEGHARPYSYKLCKNTSSLYINIYIYRKISMCKKHSHAGTYPSIYLGDSS